MTSQTVDEVLCRGSSGGRAFHEYPAQGALEQDVVGGLAPSVPLGEDPRLRGSEELRAGLAAKGELAVAGLGTKSHANRFEQRVRLAIPRMSCRPLALLARAKAAVTFCGLAAFPLPAIAMGAAVDALGSPVVFVAIGPSMLGAFGYALTRQDMRAL